jgi:hypothetical protein
LLQIKNYDYGGSSPGEQNNMNLLLLANYIKRSSASRSIIVSGTLEPDIRPPSNNTVFDTTSYFPSIESDPMHLSVKINKAGPYHKFCPSLICSDSRALLFFSTYYNALTGNNDNQG